MAPGPVPRMDPTPTTGQTSPNKNTRKKTVGQRYQKPNPGKSNKLSHSLNILQFNIDGFYKVLTYTILYIAMAGQLVMQDLTVQCV